MKRKIKRIGPQMARVAALVRACPGHYMRWYADRVNPCPIPSQNNALGYNPVNRAIEAGIVRAEPGPRRGTFILFPATDPVSAC